MKTDYLKVQKTTRFYTLGALDDTTESVWFVYHGYGQLAQYFIPKFTILDNGKNFIIAPEGLSRFYLEGFGGKVGATWMTKEDRLNDIQDNINYLNQLYDHLNLKKHKVKINILGFSQGVATACRWVADKHIKVDRLVLWAGLFPPELNYDFIFEPDNIRNIKSYIVYGNRDPFLKEEHLQTIEDCQKNYPGLNVIMFDGQHEIEEDTLKKFINENF